MSDLIERKDAIDYFVTNIGVVDADGYAVDDYDERVKIWTERFSGIPSADSEREIIHCKDCKFYTPMNRKLKIGICDMTMHHLGDDGFCSSAEKRGE